MDRVFAATEQLRTCLGGKRLKHAEWVQDPAGGVLLRFDAQRLPGIPQSEQRFFEELNQGVAAEAELVFDVVQLGSKSFEMPQSVMRTECRVGSGQIPAGLAEAEQRWIGALDAGQPESAKLCDGLEVLGSPQARQLSRAKLRFGPAADAALARGNGAGVEDAAGEGGVSVGLVEDVVFKERERHQAQDSRSLCSAQSNFFCNALSYRRI